MNKFFILASITEVATKSPGTLEHVPGGILGTILCLDQGFDPKFSRDRCNAEVLLSALSGTFGGGMTEIWGWLPAFRVTVRVICRVIVAQFWGFPPLIIGLMHTRTLQ